MIKINVLGNGGVQFLEGDVITTFNSMRVKVKEEKVVSPLQTMGFGNYPFVSVLATSEGCEILYQNNKQELCKKQFTITGTQVVSVLMGSSPLRVLKESGKLEEVSYTRILFVYNLQKTIDEILSPLFNK